MTRGLLSIFVLFLASGLQISLASLGNAWSYAGDKGPSHWSVDFPECAGHHQSPINIDTAQVKLDNNMGLVQLHGYDNLFTASMELVNNGHTAQVNLHGNYTISGGGLPGTYQAVQLHFHWGDVDQRGSEHLLNGEHFPMEMHIVHYSRRFPNISAAMHEKDGLAVLGFIFKVADSDNDAFHEILTNLARIRHRDDELALHTFSIQSLLPADMSILYRYDGSLTTPPCSETVIWTLYKSAIQISEHQLNRFRHLLKSNLLGTPEHDLVDIFRPPQALNQRVVLTNNQLGQYSGGHSSVLTSNLMLIVIYLHIVLFYI